MINLRIGDTVMIRCGSSPMTVWCIRDDYTVDVIWMAGGVTNRDAFSPNELVKVFMEDVKVTEASS